MVKLVVVVVKKKKRNWDDGGVQQRRSSSSFSPASVMDGFITALLNWAPITIGTVRGRPVQAPRRCCAPRSISLSHSAPGEKRMIYDRPSVVLMER